MKKSLIPITLITIIFLVVFCISFWESLNKFQSDNKLDNSNSVSSTSESDTIASIDDSSIATSTKLETTYGNLQSLTIIDKVSPNVGYKTGLDNLPILKWQNKEIKESGKNNHIDINYPQFIGGSAVIKLNEYISATMNSVIEGDRKEWQSVATSPDSVSYGVDVTSDYRVIGVQSGIISLEIVTTDFTLGGAGNHDQPYTINWDLKANRLLTTDDLFCNKDYLVTIAPLFETQLIADAKLSGVYSWPGFVDQQNSPDPDAWQYFLLYKNGLIAVFPPYLVSSGSSGIVRTFIPDSTSKPFLCLP